VPGKKEVGLARGKGETCFANRGKRVNGGQERVWIDSLEGQLSLGHRMKRGGSGYDPSKRRLRKEDYRPYAHKKEQQPD